MASRSGRGRNLFSSNPNGSKVAYARYKALEKARSKKVAKDCIFYIEAAGSVQAVEAIEARFCLNES